MSNLTLNLARGAAAGAIFGLGAAMVTNERSCTPAGIITGIALSAIRFYLGASAAVGAMFGSIVGYTYSPHKGSNGEAIFGGALMGAVFGYLLKK